MYNKGSFSEIKNEYQRSGRMARATVPNRAAGRRDKRPKPEPYLSKTRANSEKLPYLPKLASSRFHAALLPSIKKKNETPESGNENMQLVPSIQLIGNKKAPVLSGVIFIVICRNHLPSFIRISGSLPWGKSAQHRFFYS